MKALPRGAYGVSPTLEHPAPRGLVAIFVITVAEGWKLCSRIHLTARQPGDVRGSLISYGDIFYPCRETAHIRSLWAFHRYELFSKTLTTTFAEVTIA